MKRKWLWLLIPLVLLIAAALVGTLGFLMPWLKAGTELDPEGQLLLRQEQDGAMVLSWPEAEGADFYRVEVLSPPEEKWGEETLLFRGTAPSGKDFLLPGLPEGENLILRVSAAVNYQDWFRSSVRYSRPMEAAVRLRIPRITDLTWTADPEAGTVRVDVQVAEGVQWHYRLLDETETTVAEASSDGGTLVLRFGGEGHPLPSYGSFYRMPVYAQRQEEGILIQAMVTREPIITREDLLGRDPKAVLTEAGNNSFTITWQETKGTGYEVQQLVEDCWVTLRGFGPEEERSFTTPRLMPYEACTYRVVATGGQTLEDSQYAALSETMTAEPRELVTYATVWPIKELEAFADPALTKAADKVKALTAYCVLEEKEGAFAVGVNGKTLWIDSRYCLINLPEYLGGLCAYNITNSYSSKYMIHEFGIPRVTGVVTGGYGFVRQSDGSYLVPLLYPTAQKLLTAAKAAWERGYRVKIYDAYRPNVATIEIYDRTESILEDELPNKTYTGVSTAGLNLPAPQKDEAGEPLPLTYQWVMLGTGHELNHFLARGGSLHNLGVALDLTIETLDTGEELKMQTSMHDLSQYSVTGRNNANAKTLAEIMTGAGFGGLTTEWWHFQDNETKWSLNLPWAREGVTAEGWVKDENGWRYRTADGIFLTGKTTLHGTEYIFDQYGYLQ